MRCSKAIIKPITVIYSEYIMNNVEIAYMQYISSRWPSYRRRKYFEKLHVVSSISNIEFVILQAKDVVATL
jgi:hypothetical protein